MAKKQQRGVALMTVLGVAFVLSLMTGALVGTQQGNFSMIVSSASQKQASLSANSGLDYARFRLSRLRTLGSASHSKKLSTNGIEVTETSSGATGGSPGFVTFEGNFVGSTPARSFSVTVENRLGLAEDSARGLPKSCVVITSVGRCGTFQSKIESVLVQAPLYDAAAISNGQMDMSDVDNWVVKSQDPLRNWVRSNESIYAPDFLGPTGTKKMEFERGANKRPGVAWSKKNIYLGKSDKIVDTSNSTEAFTKTNGSMAPYATLNYNAYDLKREDLIKPSGTEASVPAGTFTINTQTLTYDEEIWQGYWRPSRIVKHTKVVSGLVYQPPVGPSKQWLQGSQVPQGQDWNWTGSHWSRTHPAVMPDGQPLANRGDVELKAEVVNIANDFTSPQMTFSFSKGSPGQAGYTPPQFTALNDGPLRVDGDLAIVSDPATTSEKPALGFAAGAAATSATQFGYLYSNSTPGAKNGDILIEGTVTGSGAIAAQRDLAVAGSSKFEASEGNLGLVLWSGRDIKFGVQADTDMAFRGLVYAKNNVSLDFAKSTGNTGNRLKSLSIEGALVAQSGKIEMGKAATVDMNYNPKYLEIFTKGLPNNTARFAQVAFKTD